MTPVSDLLCPSSFVVQGNSFWKIFSAAARVTGPGLLNASDVYAQWTSALASQQQPNFIPFNPYSGFETVGAVEYVANHA